MIVKPDIVGGQVRKDGTGTYVTRIFRVDGVQATGAKLPIDLVDDRRIPQPGKRHPWANIFVQNVSADWVGMSRNQVDVRIEYGPATQQGADAPLGSVTRDVTSQTITEVTTEDINGTTMRTRYVSGFSAGPGGSSITITDLVHEVEVQRPTFALQFRRLEPDWVWPACELLCGRTNDGPFAGKPRDTWLMNVRSTMQQDGRHQVEYQLAYNAAGWQATIIHNENGRIPLEASSGNGIETYQVYERADFRRLGLL